MLPLEKALGHRPVASFDPLLVSICVAVTLIGLSRATIYRRQIEDGFPKIVKSGRRSLIRVADIRRWEKSLSSSDVVSATTSKRVAS